jgi:hypothetical protein
LLDPSGYDAGKKIKGRKRHILVDTLDLLLERDGVRLNRFGIERSRLRGI